MYKQIFLLLLLAAHAALANAYNDKELEEGLKNAFRLKPGTTERAGDSGKAIQAYMHEGIVNKRPNERNDYTDYYHVKKQASFMGHDLIVIEEEYMSKYMGCCVDPELASRSSSMEAQAILKNSRKRTCAHSMTT